MESAKVPARLKEPFLAALKLLERRQRVSAEIESALLAKGFPQESVDEVVQLLRERHVLDDQKTIDNAVASKSGRRAVGKNKLRASFEAKGVPDDIVDRALEARSDADELQLALGLLASRFAASASSVKERAKAFRLLVSRGFDEETAHAALSAFFGDESEPH